MQFVYLDFKHVYRCLIFGHFPTDLHVSAAAWSVLLPQEKNSSQRPKASELAH